MSQHRRSIGIEGEEFAARWYAGRGYDLVERNWRNREGELDIIVVRHRHLVVCEVKTRTSDRYGSGAAAVDWRKQRTIRRVTAAYLAQRTAPAPAGIRFDVAVVTGGPKGWSIEVIEQAF